MRWKVKTTFQKIKVGMKVYDKSFDGIYMVYKKLKTRIHIGKPGYPKSMNRIYDIAHTNLCLVIHETKRSRT